METICPHCGKRYKVSDQAQGRQVRCANPNCKKTFTVASGATPGTAPAQVPQQGMPITLAGGMPLSPSPGTPQGPVPGLPPAPPAAMPAGPLASPLDDLLSTELGGPSGPAIPGTAGIPPLPTAAAMHGTPMPGAAPLAVARVARRRAKWKQPVVLAGAAGAAVLLVVVAVLLAVFAGGGGTGGAGVSAIAGGKGEASSNGLPDWAAFCVSPDTTAIAYVNIDKLRESEVLQMFERLGKEFGKAQIPQDFNIQAKMMPFKDVFLAFNKGTSVGVLRTRDDLSLETIGATLSGPGVVPNPFFGAAPGSLPGAAPGSTSPAIQNHAGVSYVKAPASCVAKLSACTYCVAEQEGHLKEALERFQRHEAPPLGSDLQEALKNTPKGDHFFVAGALVPGTLPMMPIPGGGAQGLDSKLRWFAVAGELGTSVRGQAALVFVAEADATKAKGEFDSGMANLDQSVGKVPPPMREMMQQFAKLLRGVRLSQSGSRLDASVHWSVNEIEAFGRSTASMVRSMPMMPGSGLPGAGPRRPRPSAVDGSPPRRSAIPRPYSPDAPAGVPRGQPPTR